MVGEWLGDGFGDGRPTPPQTVYSYFSKCRPHSCTVCCIFRGSDVGIWPQDHDNQHRLDESFHPVPELLKKTFCGNNYEQITVLGV